MYSISMKAIYMYINPCRSMKYTYLHTLIANNYLLVFDAYISYFCADISQNFAQDAKNRLKEYNTIFMTFRLRIYEKHLQFSKFHTLSLQEFLSSNAEKNQINEA